VTARPGLDRAGEAVRPCTADLPAAEAEPDVRVLVPSGEPVLEPTVAQALLELINVLAEPEANAEHDHVQTPMEEM
jgi:hypothetical protein